MRGILGAATPAPLDQAVFGRRNADIPEDIPGSFDMDSDIVSGEYLYRKAYGIFEKARVRCTVNILYHDLDHTRALQRHL